MRHSGILYCFAALAIAAPLCTIPLAAHASETDINAPVSQRYDLKGKVADESGAPLRGASVYIYTAGPGSGLESFVPHAMRTAGRLHRQGRMVRSQSNPSHLT